MAIPERFVWAEWDHKNIQESSSKAKHRRPHQDWKRAKTPPPIKSEKGCVCYQQVVIGAGCQSRSVHRHGLVSPGAASAVSHRGSPGFPELFPQKRMPWETTAHEQEWARGRRSGPLSSGSGQALNPPGAPRCSGGPWGASVGSAACPERLEQNPCWGRHRWGGHQAGNWLRPMAATMDVGIDLVAMWRDDVYHQWRRASSSFLDYMSPPASCSPRPWPQWWKGLPGTAAGKAVCGPASR